MYRVLPKRVLLTRLCTFFGALALIGWMLGSIFLVLFIGAAALLLWHYHQLYKLTTWLNDQRHFNPPSATGVWEQVFEGIYQLQQKNRRKRNELGAVVRRFREGAEAVPDAVIVLSDDLSIMWCNRLAQMLLGLRWPADHGQRLDNLLRQPEFGIYMGKRKFAEPLELAINSESEQMLEFRVMPYGEQQFMMVVRDVSRLKQLEQMRKDFVANVSHELRTPLTVVQGYLEMFDDSAPPAPSLWAKAQAVMVAQCNRMNALINQLLTLSRIEAARKPELAKPVDVPAMLSLIETEAASLNRDKHHDIEFVVDADLDIKGNSDELRSAFSNLVFNAVHYTANGGQIRVLWQKHGSGAEFRVIDNGDGIAPEHLNRLTERFYRVDKARSRKTGGSGLGLAIVKHVLSRHRSKLEIKSELSKGSEFSFRFPASLVHNRAKTRVAG